MLEMVFPLQIWLEQEKFGIVWMGVFNAVQMVVAVKVFNLDEVGSIKRFN